LLTSFSTVLEKALYKRLIEHVNNNNVLRGQQFSFGKRLATEDATFKLTHEILNALNRREWGVSFMTWKKRSTR
jgi:FAD synthase